MQKYTHISRAFWRKFLLEILLRMHLDLISLKPLQAVVFSRNTLTNIVTHQTTTTIQQKLAYKIHGG